MQNLVIVVPCYNEEAVLPETVKRLSALLNRLVASGKVADAGSYALLVNDGSSDATWPMICRYADENRRIGGVNLAANSGHQNALMAGMETALNNGADMIVTIDADLQDDVEVIEQMVDKRLGQEQADIVYGVRRERKTDTWFKRTTALAFYSIMRRLGVKSIYNHADYRLMSRRAVTALMNYRERNLFLRGIVPLIGYNTAQVQYDRTERFAGESKYPLTKMVNFAIDGITSFSVKPVRYVFGAGMVFVLIAVIILVYTLARYFSGHTVAGWTSMILSMWFIGGVLLISLGVLGEYIAKIYIEVKDRPRYIIEKTITPKQ